MLYACMCVYVCDHKLPTHLERKSFLLFFIFLFYFYFFIFFIKRGTCTASVNLSLELTFCSFNTHAQMLIDR